LAITIFKKWTPIRNATAGKLIVLPQFVLSDKLRQNAFPLLKNFFAYQLIVLCFYESGSEYVKNCVAMFL
jgi:hypothetical protein